MNTKEIILRDVVMAIASKFADSVRQIQITLESKKLEDEIAENKINHWGTNYGKLRIDNVEVNFWSNPSVIDGFQADGRNVESEENFAWGVDYFETREEMWPFVDGVVTRISGLLARKMWPFVDGVDALNRIAKKVPPCGAGIGINRQPSRKAAYTLLESGIFLAKEARLDDQQARVMWEFVIELAKSQIGVRHKRFGPDIPEYFIISRLTGDDPMPFGVHRDKRLGDVPDDYLDWLCLQSWIEDWPDLMNYVDPRCLWGFC